MYNGNIFFSDIEIDKFAGIHGVPNESSEKERSAFLTIERKRHEEKKNESNQILSPKISFR